MTYHERPPCFVCEKREAEPGQILCQVCIEWAEVGCGTNLKGDVKCGHGGVCIGCFNRRRARDSALWALSSSAALAGEDEKPPDPQREGDYL